jgi:hypothetical protein
MSSYRYNAIPDCPSLRLNFLAGVDSALPMFDDESGRLSNEEISVWTSLKGV